MNNNQRLQILSDDEITELYTVPQFNATERNHYFVLPETVLHSLKIMKTNGRNTSAKLWFILQYGYFRAKHQFFHVSYSQVKEDVSFIMTNYLPNDSVPPHLPSRRVQGLVKYQILKQMGYSDDTSKIRPLVIEKANQFARIMVWTHPLLNGVIMRQNKKVHRVHFYLNKEESPL